ncbi:MAG: sulfotransferase [Fibrobacteres bacterium]|nr:sulfotransferase [Fibrobacterota bacterium]
MDSRKISLANNYLYGIGFRAWLRLLKENRWKVEPRYWHRAAAVTSAALVNSLVSRVERGLYAAKVASTPAPKPPLFVLGHWRAGTTHLQYLLASDRDRFACPNTLQVMSPETFLLTEGWLAPILRFFIPKTRPMDGMALSAGSPAEDEFAMALMTGRSPYCGVSFPANRRYYARYLTFKEAEAGAAKEWQDAFGRFARKLAWRHGARTLAFKSPAHTARIPLLLELFPDARFVHIVRDPYAVFKSSRHTIATLFPYMYLQSPDPAEVDEDILQRYETVNDAYLADRNLIPPGRLHEMRYEDLAADPLRELERMYGALGYGPFGAAGPFLEGYLATVKSYRTNDLHPLESRVKALVAGRWERFFSAFRYPS